MSPILDEPQPRSAIGFGMAVRLLAIALGVMSALLLAKDGLNVALSDFLDNVLNVYNGGLEYVALLVLGPAITAAFAALRDWFELSLQLHPHWKHVTVLLWLHLGSAARHQDEYEGPHALNWILAAALAIIFGVTAGTAQLSHPSVFWWAGACMLLFEAVAAASRAAFKRWPAHPTWWAQFSIMGFPALLLGSWCVAEADLEGTTGAAGRWFLPFAIYSIYLALLPQGGWSGNIGQAFRGLLLLLLVMGVPTSITQLIQTSTNPGLAALVALVVADGVGALVAGLLHSGEEGGISGHVAQTALDKLAVLGGAAFIVWLSNALPT